MVCEWEGPSTKDKGTGGTQGAGGTLGKKHKWVLSQVCAVWWTFYNCSLHLPSAIDRSSCISVSKWEKQIWWLTWGHTVSWGTSTLRVFYCAKLPLKRHLGNDVYEKYFVVIRLVSSCQRLEVPPPKKKNPGLVFYMFEKWKCSCSVVSLCDPIDCSPPDSSVYGILQARILDWAAIPVSRGSSWPRDQTWVSHITVRFFTIWLHFMW